MNEYQPDVVSPPGETLRDWMEEKWITIEKLNALIDGFEPITPEMAIDLERITGISAEFWNKREEIYCKNRKKINDILSEKARRWSQYFEKREKEAIDVKTVKFQDEQNYTIQVSLSSSGDYRVYFDVEKEGSPCLLLNKYQANILINALQELIFLNE
jgi:plasmid maintenance system antidote protein VapI